MLFYTDSWNFKLSNKHSKVFLLLKTARQRQDLQNRGLKNIIRNQLNIKAPFKFRMLMRRTSFKRLLKTNFPRR